MNTEQEKMLRDWSRLDWRDAARCKPQPLQAAVAALLAERDKMHEVAESLSLQYDEVCSDRNRMRDERDALLVRCEEAEAERDATRSLLYSQGRDHTQPCNLGTLCPWCEIEQLKAARDAALAKLGVVSEIAITNILKHVGQGQDEELVSTINNINAAFDSVPGLVAVVDVIAVADHEVVVGRPDGYEFGPNDRAIIVRSAE